MVELNVLCEIVCCDLVDFEVFGELKCVYGGVV